MQWKTEAVEYLGILGICGVLAPIWNFLEGKSEEYPGACLVRQVACLGDNSEREGESSQSLREWNSIWTLMGQARVSSAWGQNAGGRGIFLQALRSVANQPNGPSSSDALEEPDRRDCTIPSHILLMKGIYLFCVMDQNKNKVPNFISAVLFHVLEEFTSYIYKLNKTYSFIYLFISSEEWFLGLKDPFLLLISGISPAYLLYKTLLLGPKAENGTLLKSCLMKGSKEVISSCLCLFMLLVWRLFLECWLMLNLTLHWHRMILPEPQHQSTFYYFTLMTKQNILENCIKQANKTKRKSSVVISIY